MLIPAILAAFFLLSPPQASAQVCRGGTCADGFNGCGCGAAGIECCRKRMQGAGGASSGPSGGGGFSPEMATMNLMMNFMQSFSAMQQARGVQDQQQAQLQAQQVAEEQRRIAAYQAQLRAEAQAKFTADRDALSSGFKGEVPDLSKPPEFKSDEPVRKAKVDPDEKCRKTLPHAFYAAEDTDASWAAKQKVYLKELSAWDRQCGTGDAVEKISAAKSARVGALIAYDSRLLWLSRKEPRTLADKWEYNRLLETGESLDAKLTNAERAEVVGLTKPTFDPPHEGKLSVLDVAGLKALETAPVPPKRAVGDWAVAGVEKANAGMKWITAGPMEKGAAIWNKEWVSKNSRLGKFVRGTPPAPGEKSIWENMGNWRKAKAKEFNEYLPRQLADIGYGGVQNEKDYSK